MGYSRKQMKELEATINSAECDAVIDATPVTLPRIIKLSRPVVQVNYELQEGRSPDPREDLEAMDIAVVADRSGSVRVREQSEIVAEGPREPPSLPLPSPLRVCYAP